MQNFIWVALAVLATTAAPVQEKKMSNGPFSMTAQCRDNPQCIFDKTEIFIDLEILNNSRNAVGLPLTFINQIGPYCTLVDNETQEKIQLRVGLPDHSKSKDYVKIQPNETIKLVRRITPGQIRSIRPEMTDLTAKITVSGLVQLVEGQDPVKFDNHVDIRIIGKDKLERNSRH